MPWWIDLISKSESLFDGGIVGLFRILLAISIILKFSVETMRRYYEYFKPHTYLYDLYQFPRKGQGFINESVWKAFYIFKIIAAFTLLVGIYSRLSLLILIIWFVIEMKVYFKYHVNFIFLLCCILMFSKSIDNAFSLSVWLNTSSIREFIQVSMEAQEFLAIPIFIMISLFSLYFFSAIHKCNFSFISGEVLSRTIKYVENERYKRKYFDFKLPKFLIELLVYADGTPRIFLKGLMICTLCLEIVLPLMLIFPSTQFYAIVLGVLMHTGFTLLFPNTLAHFSLITLSCYLLFLDPIFLQNSIIFIIQKF